jgi:hypothetical protein
MALEGGGQDGADEQEDRPGRVSAGVPAPAPELPRGGRRIFPDFRVVGFYGAPQDDELGELGIGSPEAMARRLDKQAEPYARKSRPVLPVYELLATIAAAAPGDDGKYRIRQDPKVIQRYLRAARRHKALLLLDIQPGHADFLEEAKVLERWLREPDVGLALDPEWLTPGAVPGSVIGSVSAEKVNEVATWLSELIRVNRLPEKLFVIHQFTDEMVVGKDTVQEPPGLAVTFNVDGFGDRPNKISKYRAFTSASRQFNDGFKLFYREDTNLMKPADVLRLKPPPDLIVYE